MSKLQWRYYLIEGAGLGVFMISACVFTVLLEHPASPLRQAIGSPIGRRAAIGIAMGLTAIGLIYSRWGKESGAHFNPAVTLTFLGLGKVGARDAISYIGAQFVGGILGMTLASLSLWRWVSHPDVYFVTTIPGTTGWIAAFAGEFLISLILMSTVLIVSNHARMAWTTGLWAGVCVALFIVCEAPLSGMSMNPARTLASAILARQWTALWIYFIAPPVGMLIAAALYVGAFGGRRVFCAKLHHQNSFHCLFCGYRQAKSASETVSAVRSKPVCKECL